MKSITLCDDPFGYWTVLPFENNNNWMVLRSLAQDWPEFLVSISEQSTCSELMAEDISNRSKDIHTNGWSFRKVVIIYCHLKHQVETQFDSNKYYNVERLVTKQTLWWHEQVYRLQYIKEQFISPVLDPFSPPTNLSGYLAGDLSLLFSGLKQTAKEWNHTLFVVSPRKRLSPPTCLEYDTVWLILKLLLVCFDMPHLEIRSMHTNQLELNIHRKFMLEFTGLKTALRNLSGNQET